MTNAAAPTGALESNDAAANRGERRGANGVARALAVAFVAALAAACGGSQTGPSGLWVADQGPVLPVDHVLALVPEGVSYAFVADLTAEDSAMLRAQWDANPMMRSVGEEIARETGIDFSSPDALTEIGVDLEGEVAVFSTALAPIAVMRLSSADAFLGFVAEQRERNPDIAWTEFELAGAAFQSGASGDAAIDLAIIGDYAVVRARAGDEDLDVDDATLAAIIAGEAGPGLDTDPRIASLRNRGEGTVTGLSIVSTTALWQGISRVAQGELGAYRDDAHRAACTAASERTLASIPWMGMVQRRDDANRYLTRSHYVTHLGEQATERAASFLPGTIEAAFDAAGDAAFYMAGNLDFAAVIDAMGADPELRDCPDLAAIPGNLAAFRERYQSAISGARRQFSGLGAIAVYGADVSGLFPRADLAVMVGSPDPVAIVESVQAVIESNGGTGRVDETAPFTTLDYGLFGYQIRIVQTQDRVVVTVGEVPREMSNSLASAEAGTAGGEFHNLRINGPRLAELVAGIFQRISDMGVLPAEQVEAMRGGLATYELIRWIDARAHLDGSDLVLEVNTEFDAPAAD